MGGFDDIKDNYEAILHKFDDEIENNSMLSFILVLDSSLLEDVNSLTTYIMKMMIKPAM
jgi:hypothetical protein